MKRRSFFGGLLALVGLGGAAKAKADPPYRLYKWDGGKWVELCPAVHNGPGSYRMRLHPVGPPTGDPCEIDREPQPNDELKQLFRDYPPAT